MTPNRREFIASTAAAFASIGGLRTANSMNVPSNELQWLTLNETRDRIVRGEWSSVEATQLMLDRISSLDPRLNSYITVTAKSALEAAARCDEATAKKEPPGPLHGVPIGIKDVCYTKDIKTTAATKVLSEFTPTFDATVVRRLKKAGAVILGKLNLCEGAMTAYSRSFEVPANPWDIPPNADTPAAWPGSSSSGSAVAVAAGLTYAAIGTDTGGSIRYPASYCGVVGLKPSWGRVSRHGVFPLALSLDHIGPFARCTRDCAIILDAISGYDQKDATVSLGQSQIATKLDQNIRGLRVGWDSKYSTDGVEPELAKKLNDAKNLFQELGAEIVEIEFPDLGSYGKDWVTICSVEAFRAHSAYFPARSDEYGLGFRGWLQHGQEVSASEYARSVQRKQECVGKVTRALSNVDVLLCPVDEGQVIKVTESQQYDKYADPVFEGNWARYTAVFNFSGAPALTMPCGFNNDGLPLSLQLVGKVGREDVVCRLGHAYESATDFHTKHPEL